MLNYQQLYPDRAEPTFDKVRKCLNCDKLIPDQAHASRIHCPQVKINGESFDCKSERHTQKDSSEDKRDREIIKNIKSIDKRISEMISYKGSIVSWEDLDAFHIRLEFSKRHEFKKNGEMTCEFITHKINLNPYSQKHTISTL